MDREKQKQLLQRERERAAVHVLTSDALFHRITSYMTGFPMAVLEFARRVEPQHRRWLAYQHSQLPSAERDDAPLQLRGMLPFVAVKEGDMKILQTLYELQRFCRYRTNEKLQFVNVVVAAVQYGRLDMLKWLHERKDREPQVLVWDAGLLNLAIRYRHIELMDWIDQHCPYEALLKCGVEDIHWRARSGNLDVIRWLHRRGYKFTTREMDEAAKHDHLSDVRFLHEHREEGCTTEAMDAAAARGNLEIVQFLHFNRTEGCTTNAMDGAAKNGYLEVVRFLHEHRSEGCTRLAMDYAAAFGHLAVVQFLHEHRNEGCTTNAMHLAAIGNHVDVVTFLGRHRRESCTFDTLVEVVRKNLPRVVKVLCEYSTEGCLFEAKIIANVFRQQEVVEVLDGFISPHVRACTRAEHVAGGPRRCQKPRAQLLTSTGSYGDSGSSVSKQPGKRAFIRQTIRKCLGKSPR